MRDRSIVRSAAVAAAVFSSCPYRAPCVSGWVADPVQVTFENIATSLRRG